MNGQHDVELLSKKYQRQYGHSWRVAVVSLFSFESMGLRAIYSFMKECRYDIDLVFLKEHALNRFDMPTERERTLFIDLLKERGVKTVALGVRSPYLSFAVDLTKQIHEELGVPVIWGGTAATVTPELCIQSGADYAICGEGEEAFAELVTALATGANTSRIANLWVRGPDGPVSNPPRQLIAHLDSLPIPDLADENKFYVEFGRLREGDPWRDCPRYELMASRGCPYMCTFCSNSVFHDMYKGLGRFVRLRSVEHVMREMEDAREMLPRLNVFFLADEVFGTRLDWLRQFKEAYLSRIGLPLECVSDPRTLTEDRVKLLKEAGVVELNVGIQTGSEKVRRELFNRHVSDDQILEVARLVKKYDIFARYDIIADNPFESRDDKRDTLDLLLGLPKPFILNLYSLNHFPKTKLTELALREGVITEDDVAGNSDRCLRQLTVSFGFPRPPEDKCWNALFSMSSKTFIPKWLLRWIAGNEWFMRHPLPVVVLARASSLIRLFFDGCGLLLKGRIDRAWIRRFARSIGSISR
jgi:anaerobic magnesium-protoporphyrin IX monomethyl ester cyclase